MKKSFLKRTGSALMAIFTLIVGAAFSPEIINSVIIANAENDVSSMSLKWKNHSYKIIEKKLTPMEAEAYCEKSGGHLVTITSEDEQKVVLDLISKYAANVWFTIGASDYGHEGTWEWMNGETFSYNNWGNGEPNNGLGRGQEYAQINSKTGLWDDYYGLWDNYTDIKDVFICEWDEPEGITLNKGQLSLGKGETYKLTATVAPTYAKDKSVKWRTSNSKILTVDQKGNVKAIGNGTAWITARTVNGKEKSCKITVKNAPTKVSLSKGDFAMGVGETFTLSAVLPEGTAASKRTFRTSNNSIIKMTKTDWTGSFKALKAGTAWVTVRLYNGVEKSCKITVKPAPTNVYVNKKTINLKVGQTAKLSAYLNSGAACATRTFRSSAPSIIKMTKTNWEGEFKAMSRGVAWVTVRTYNGKESSCKVTVS